MSAKLEPHARTEFFVTGPHGLPKNEFDYGLLTTCAELSSKQERSMSESVTFYPSRSVHAQDVVRNLRAAHTAFINRRCTQSPSDDSHFRVDAPWAEDLAA